MQFLQIPKSLLDEEEEIAVALNTRKSLIPKKEKYAVEPIEIELQNRSRRSSSSSENSNTWQLLLANLGETFEISHIGSNIIQRKKHWLDRPNIPWEKMNESRIKCENWLNKSN